MNKASKKQERFACVGKDCQQMLNSKIVNNHVCLKKFKLRIKNSGHILLIIYILASGSMNCHNMLLAGLIFGINQIKG